MPFRLLSGKVQYRLMTASFALPAAMLLVGSAITAYIGVIVQRAEIRSRISSLETVAREQSRQLDMTMLNGALRVQSMLELYGPNWSGLMRQRQTIEEILRHTVFQKVSLYRMRPEHDQGGHLELKRVYVARAAGQRMAATTPNAVDQDTALLQSKIHALESNGRQNAYAIGRSNGEYVLNFIWRSQHFPNEYALFSTPLHAVFSNSLLNTSLLTFLRDRDTGAKILVSWAENGSAQIDVPEPTVAQETTRFQRFPASDGGADFSSLDVAWIANPEKSIGALTWAVWIAGALITTLLSLLVRFIADQNRKISELVVRRTVDLEAALMDATEANLAKTRFLANMSHELRTPLNIILGMIDMVEEKTREAKALEFVKAIRISGDQLLDLITDLLYMASKDTEHREVIIKDMPIKSPLFFEEIARLVTPDCHKKGLSFRLVVAPEVPEAFRGDPAKLRQILMNLVRNSIKYTTQGHVALKVSVRGQPRDGKVPLRVSVEDSGIGIPQSKQRQIFERFVQLEGTKVLSQGGVGLGLSIVRDLIEKMGGSISVDSTPGKGSVFTVDLNLAEGEKRSEARTDNKSQDKKPTSPAPHLNNRQLKVLIADDDPGNCQLLEAYLADTGWNLRFTENGEEAFEAYRKQAPDVVIADLRMPVMDGFELTDRIREFETAGNSNRIPVILVTADVLDETAQAAAQHGVTAFLTKPLRKSKIVEAVLAAVSAQS